jgi:tetratricopeptide (TPR) repeat protein
MAPGSVEAVRRVPAWLLIGLVVLLSACGGSKRGVMSAPPMDREFLQSSRMARAVLENDRLPQAIELYRQALDRAYLMADLDAIVDTRYNLAVCQLKFGDPAAALENLTGARRELDAAGRAVPADLLQVQATALYRSGDSDAAARISARILEGVPPPPPEVEAGAHYLLGRVAADRGDTQGLKAEVAALGEPLDPRLAADRLELQGRQAMLEARWEDAASLLDDAARLRAESRDYREMALTLAIAARACERAQRPEAGAYRYLRAARSAMVNGQTELAENWLGESLRLAERAGAASLREEVIYYRSKLASEPPLR